MSVILHLFRINLTDDMYRVAGANKADQSLVLGDLGR